MQTHPNYEQYSLSHLRVMLRYVDPEQMPERFSRIKSEIEKCEASDPYFTNFPRVAVPQDDGEGGTFLIVAFLLALGVYALIFLAILTVFGSMIMVRTKSDLMVFLFITVLPCTIIAAMAGSGIVIMRYLLRKVKDVDAVQAWSFMAAALAPVSSFAYAVCYCCVESYMNAKGLITNYPSDSDSYLPTIILYGTGFYLPFILSTLWMKYWYRQDES